MLHHAVADARQFLELLWLLDELLDGLRQGIDQLSGFLVTSIAADDGAVNSRS